MTLPAGPPLASLESLDGAWPDGNPRDNGFAFKGYSLNKAGVPTFKYRWNEANVTDTILPFETSPDNGLQRTVTVAPANKLENAWLRIASGQNVEESDGAVIVDGVRFQIEGKEPVVRTINNRRELLIPMTVNAGETATVRIIMTW
jgi:hypothetical protein